MKAKCLGGGSAPGKTAIAKLRLTMPPTMLGDFAFARKHGWGHVDTRMSPLYDAAHLAIEPHAGRHAYARVSMGSIGLSATPPRGASDG